MERDILRIRQKPLKGEDGCRTFSVRIREDIVSRMDLIAAQTGRSRNELVGIFLEYALDQGICCAALGGVVWDFVSHLTPAQLLAAMDSAALETLRAIRDILEDDTLEDPECVQRIDAILSAFYLKLGAEVHRRGI